MRTSIHETGDVDASITSEFKVRATISMNGEGHEVSMFFCICILMYLVLDNICQTEKLSALLVEDSGHWP